MGLTFFYYLLSNFYLTMQHFILQVATAQHLHYADTICNEMESSAKARGTGIAKRTPEYIQQKMLEGKAVIALSTKNVCHFNFPLSALSLILFAANSKIFPVKSVPVQIPAKLTPRANPIPVIVFEQ